MLFVLLYGEEIGLSCFRAVCFAAFHTIDKNLARIRNTYVRLIEDVFMSGCLSRKTEEIGVSSKTTLLIEVSFLFQTPIEMKKYHQSHFLCEIVVQTNVSFRILNTCTFLAHHIR